MSDISKTVPDVKPGDSASQCGRSTTSSTTSRARRDAAARKAALQAQAQLLQEQQELELQALHLQQRMAELKLKSQIASADAEERVYSESEVKFRSHGHPPSAAKANNDDTLPYPRPDSSESMIKMLHEGQQQQRKLIESVTLPQADLMKYDGSPLRYWEFWRAFENSVDKTSVDDSVKLTRLLHFCTGEAHKLLHACMVMEPTEGYLKAKQMLKERYGNPYRIADAWIQRVTQATKIEPNNKKALQDLADELNICIQTLDAMGYKSELSPQSVLLRIVERLPFFLRDRWLKTVANVRKQNRLPQIEDLLSFVQDTAAQQNDPVYGRLTDLKPAARDQSRSSPKRLWDRQKQGQRSSYSTSSNPVPVHIKPCLMCKNSHTLFGCDQFKKMAPDKRLQFAKDNRLCFNCLRPGHMLTACGLNRTCSVEGCGRKHTKFLHQIKKTPSRTPNTQAEDPPHNQAGQSPSDGASNGYADTRSNAIGAGGRSVLPIVPVRLQSDGKNFIETYALLDSGSTHSFCTEALARQLGAKRRSHQLRLTTLDKKDDHIDTTMVGLVVDSGPSTDRIYLPHVCTRKRLNIQTAHMAYMEDIINLPHLRGIDIPIAGEHEVGLLIGQDTPRALIPLEVRKADKGPYAVRTALGWSLHGPVASGRRHDASTNYIQGDTYLDEQIQKLWKLEDESTLFDDERGMSFNDRKAVDIWENTITMDNGHYQLAIPFKERPPSLQDNRCIAEHRLQSLGRRLERDTHLHGKYKEGISDLLQKGYAEEVPESDDKVVTWYIPHHPVFHPMKPDKVRIVFDCASKYKGQSLNDVVLQGPDLTNKLVGVLLRFRQERIAIIADIEAMFHQVRVPPEDRDVLRFLWWPDGNLRETPKAFRMCVHLFGGTWSPSVCNFAMRRTAEDNQGQCASDAARVVQRNFYVDDCLVSVQDEDEAVKLAAELRMLLRKGGFRLAKWLSNNPRVLQTIPLEDRAKQVAGLDLNREALPVERALGMRWDIEQDCFTYKINPKDKPSTRRGLLSIVSSVYDPLGYASPCVLQAKLILQELTRQKLGWDEPIPDEEAQKWKSWLDELPEMEGFEINRCVKPHDFGKVTDYQLHNFADASEVAYGAVSYLMTTNEDGQVYRSLLMAKTRLAPLKTTTIPRLELLAATLATKLDTMIRRELDFPIAKSTFWTDSMIVLNYIQNKEKRFRTFVSNRLATIHNATETDQWRHVDSALNPADIISRGMPASELKESSRWLQGPEFLQQPEGCWPAGPGAKQEISDDDPEVKTAKGMHNFASSSDAEDCIEKLITHYSDWTRLRRAIAWWLRLKKVLQEKVRKTTPIQDGDKTLTVKEIEGAEKAIFQHVQSHAFSEETSVLRDPGDSGETVPRVTKGSKLYKLDPIYQDGLLRVGGRLRRAMIPSEAKHQVILPKKHHVTSLLVRYTHHRVGHQGQNHVLAEIRQRYWILGAGVVVRSMLKKCVNCRKYQARLGKQKMADLPSFRLEATEPAFTNVGMDYFGPFEIKCGRSTRKRYGVVFTCMTTRAIHIEVAHSLDTSSCIDAIRRMISRRGPIKKLVSDNGTNLVGAQAELKRALKEWNEEEILHFTANQGIKWTFNPPTASHQGGVWERQIRTIRKILHAILTEQYLRTCHTEEQLHTLMCEVEAIVNSRPLTRVSDDPDDLEVLTPSSLLMMKQVTEPPPGRFTGGDVYARKRWRQMQYLADLFWKRWLREYLPTLQQRQRWQQPERNLQIGDVVLIADETAPRCSWLMGHVLETHPDKQGYVRSVKVKTATSTFIRPVTKLCLLLEQEI